MDQNHLSERTTNHLIDLTDKNLNMHQENKNIAYKAINNILFTVSAGTLVISISLIGYLKDPFILVWLLPATWLSLLLSIAAMLMTLMYQIKESRRQRQLINTFRATGFRDHMNFDTEIVDKDKILNSITKIGKRYSFAVLFFLALGLFCLVWFGSMNFVYQNIIRKERQQFEENEKVIQNSALEAQTQKDLLQIEILKQNPNKTPQVINNYYYVPMSQ